MQTLVISIVLLAGAALGQPPGRCPIHIQVSKSGAYYTNRFGGNYKTSPKLLERDLRSGCYSDANPSMVTSVTVRIAPAASRHSIEKLYDILQRNGWPKSKILLIE